jgi:hypothetical protein
MATTKVTQAFTSYGARGNREDLNNVITNIDPTSTPFVSAIGRRNVSNRTYDWQTEDLPAVNATNFAVEGFVAVAQAPIQTVRQTNVTQIMQRTFAVSNTQEEVDAAGKSSELAHQTARFGLALRRDMEAIFTGAQARVDGDDGGTPAARRTRALEHFVQTNVSTGVGYAAPASGTAAMTDGTARAFTQTLLDAALQTCFESGAEPSIIMVGPGNKRTFGTFTGRSNSRVRADVDEIVTGADFYLSDWGELKVVPNRFSRNRTALLLDPEYAKTAYLRPMRTVTLGTTGDAETRMIVVEAGLQVDSEKAHGKVADLT